MPVTDQNGIVLLDHDEFIRGESTLEGLGALPSFEMMGQMGFDATALRKYSHVERIHHVHTPGNSSGIVDGAAAMLIGSAAKGKELGLKPRARIVATAVTSTDPTIMLTGPAPATRKALAKAGLSVADIDLFEVNEAFASVVMKFMKDMGVPEEKVNVNGGSIAMGHPWAPPVAPSSAPCSTSWRSAICVTASPPCVSAAAWVSQRSSSAFEAGEQK